MVASVLIPSLLLIADRQHPVRPLPPGLSSQWALGANSPSPGPSALEVVMALALANLWMLAIHGFLPPQLPPLPGAHSLYSLHLNHLSGTVFLARTQSHTVLSTFSQDDSSMLRQRVRGHHRSLIQVQCLSVENDVTSLQNLDHSSLFLSGIFSLRPMHFNICIIGLGQNPPESHCKIYIMGEPSQKVWEGRGIKRAYDSERSYIGTETLCI